MIPASAPFGEVLAAVTAARPTHLVGYASVVGQLARAALAGELKISPIRVSTNSEPSLARIGRRYGTLGTCRSTTCGDRPRSACRRSAAGAATACTCVRTKWCSNGSIKPERQSPQTSRARTLATGLANRTFPFIRYDLGDQITVLPGRCECGNRFTRLADIAGRRDDDFRYPACTVPASVFRHALGTDPRICEYQVRQTPTGAEILTVGSPDVAALTISIAAALRRHGLPDPQLQIRIVDQIQRHEATGKLRRFIARP